MLVLSSSWFLCFLFLNRKMICHLNAWLSSYNVQCSLPQVWVPWDLDHQLSSGVTTGDQRETPKLLFMLYWGGWKGKWISGFWKYFARISDSKRDFNGFPDPAVTADCGFIDFFRPGFWSLRVIKIFLPRFWIQGEILMADLVNKS